MNYGELIRQAFWIARHKRHLWFFGFFAGGSSFNCGGNVPTGGDAAGGEDLGDFLAENLGLVIAIGVAIVAIALVFIVLSLIAQGALADGVAAIDRGETGSFGLAWRAGLSHFWRVLGESLLFAAMGIGLLLAIGGPVALLIAGTVAATESVAVRVVVIVLLALVAIVVLVAVFFVFGVVFQLTLRELVVRRQRVVAALRAGWWLFRSRLGTSLLVGLLAIALALAGGLVLLLGAFVVAAVLAVPAILLAVSGYVTAAIVAGVVAALLLLVPFLVAAGALGTFNHALWTLAYLRLSARWPGPQTTPAPWLP